MIVWIRNAKNMQVSQDYVCCFNSGVQLLNKHIVAPRKAFDTPVYKEFKWDIVLKRFSHLGPIFMLFSFLTPMMNGLHAFQASNHAVEYCSYVMCI